jgi:putative transposase
VDTLFAQYVAGYVGNSVENRGRNADQAAAWSIVELQDLLDEWVVSTWQNRPHDGLRDPLAPGAPLTPNEKYAALVSAALRRHARQPSGVAAKKNRWEIHYDPYDVSRIWVRNHRDGGWMEATWTHLKTGPVPFGELAWEHAQRMLAQRGINRATEAQIAAAASDLLDRAGKGPAQTAAPAAGATRQGQRAAALTRATTSEETRRTWPGRPAEEPAKPAETAAPPAGSQGGRAGDAEDDPDGEATALVAPLGVFDAALEGRGDGDGRRP